MMKISIITPSFNSGDYLEKAIQSVLIQDYKNYEHIVVDGGSSDNTLSLLDKYEHIRWISEPDDGQVDAMNKGFHMATGDILVYLNADDYFLEGAFSAVIPHFEEGAKMVMGKVKVYTQKADKEWINDPKTDFDSMLKHWEPNAFCVNPVAYFYLKEIQEEFPYNLDNDAKQDLEFLIDVASKYQITKIDRVLGVFFDNMDAKTFKDQIQLDYWRPVNFPFIDRHLESLPDEYVKDFRARQRAGYQLRTQWTVQDCIRLDLIENAIAQGQLAVLPCPQQSIEQDYVVDNGVMLGKGNTAVVIVSFDNIGVEALSQTIKSMGDACPFPVYYLKIGSEQAYGAQDLDAVFFSAFKEAYQIFGDTLRWKVITFASDPVHHAFFGNYVNRVGNSEEINRAIECFNERVQGWFRTNVIEFFGINLSACSFDFDLGYGLASQDNIELLVIRLDQYHSALPGAMKEYFGVSDVTVKPLEYERYCQGSSPERYNTLDGLTVRNIYTSDYMKRFFSKTNIKQLVRKWAPGIKQPMRPNILAPKYFCSEKGKIAYLSIPKNACTTIKFALLAKGDKEHMSLLKTASKIHSEADTYFDSIVDVFNGKPDGYYTFTFVRNPYSRFFSFYRNKIYLNWDMNLDAYLREHEITPKMSMRKCLERISRIDVYSMNEHFAPQSAFVYNRSICNVDFIGKLENLKGGVAGLEERAGFKFLLPSINVTSGKEKLEVDEETISLIQTIYREDFINFDYSMEFNAKEVDV